MTIDDDVAAALQRLRKNRDVGLKKLVNDVLRRGLENMAPKQREPFRTQSVSLGRALLPNVDNVAESLVIAEAEAFK